MMKLLNLKENFAKNGVSVLKEGIGDKISARFSSGKNTENENLMNLFATYRCNIL